jgi:hypothetical protein
MKTKIFYRIFMAGSTAFLIAGPVIVFLFVGLWLDGLLGTSPIFALVGGLAGFTGSIMSLLKFLKTTK